MPDWSARVRERLAGLRLDPATEIETIEELAQHVDDRYRDLLARGVPDASAAEQAWRELDGHERLARDISTARRALMPDPVQDNSKSGVGALLDDFAFAWRRLRHAPGFAIVALVTVMLTVGANAAILSVADAVLFRPLPYADPDAISIIQMLDRKTGKQFTNAPYAYLEAINDGCPSVSAVGLLEDAPYLRVASPEGVTSVRVMSASANYFGLLGARPARGRFFSEADAGAEGRAAVLSYSAWRTHYAGDESIVGRSVILGTATFDIVGILPEGFVFPSARANPSVVTLAKPIVRGAKGGTFYPIVRMEPGVSREAAQAEIAAATALTSASLGQPNSVPALNDVRAILYPVGQPIMRYLLAAAGLILILGCANLANMMLVRGRRGLRETAVRLALGASRTRLIRPMLFEAAIVGIAGAVLAVVFTSLLFDALLKQVPPVAYGRAPVGVDARVIGISLALGVFGVLIFSIVPAWRAAGVDVLALLQRRSGRGHPRARLGRPLVAAQVAIAVAVVFGAAIAGRAFVTVLRTPLGFSVDRVVEIGVAPAVGATGGREFYQRVAQELSRRPDVMAAGATGSQPFSRSAANEGARASGSTRFVAGIVFTLPGYFDVMSMPLLRGRSFTWDDVSGDPNAAVISVGAAKAMFADREPVGETFDNGDGRQFHVIGVVGDVRTALFFEQPPRVYAFPAPQLRNGMSIVARMRDRSDRVVQTLKSDLRAFSPAGATVEWFGDRVSADDAYRDPRFQMIVLTTLAALALGLTALGIFSVVAYLVAARTREMGVRLAIGASPQALVVLVIRQALTPVAIGVVAGLVLIKWLSRLAEAQFFKVETHDPLIVVAVAVTVIAAAVVAAYLPARRATRINPTEVLRAE
jgi:predicted permease